MKRIYFLFIPFLFAACEKESQRNGQKLVEIRSASKTQHTYIYEGDRLTKMNFYSFCTIPSDEVSFIYQNGRVEKVISKMRGMYSSTAAICDPASGITSEETLVYDGSGRLIRTDRITSYSTYQYNSDNQIIAENLYQSNGTLANTYTFKYDSRGNIIEQTGPTGNMTFVYDDKVNPFYIMKQKPSYISAFTTSPNNVIKGTSTIGGNFERNITEYENGMPKKVVENGVLYEYVYN